MNQLEFHDMTLTWLPSTQGIIDGGPIFGVVPTPVWRKKYPHNPETFEIEKVDDPILIQYQGKNYLIDASFDTSKFDDKTYRNTGTQHPSVLHDSLRAMNLKPEDIDVILMTHMHNDHASGLTRLQDDEYISVFPNAKIYLSEIEWEEVRQPNDRTRGTYLAENWQPIADQVITFKDTIEVVPGIEMHLAGGHSKGLAIILLSQKNEKIIHLSDLIHTTASTNPLWVTAFDDYPMDTIAARKKWQSEAFEGHYKFIFYHDAYYCMIEYDKKGQKVVNSLKREKNFLYDPTNFYQQNEAE